MAKKTQKQLKKLRRFTGSGERAPPSKIDLLSGKHTTSIIVGMVFLVTLIGLIIIVCIRKDVPESLTTGLIGILGVLAGFFVRSLKS